MNRNPRHSIMARRTGGQAGTAALELVIVAPAVLAVFLLILALIRTSTAAGAVASAARDAARQASIARTPAAARASALTSAREALSQDGLGCNPVVIVGTGGFGVRVGVPATVSATVSCTVPLSDLGLPGLPGSKTLRATFISSLDPYRQR